MDDLLRLVDETEIVGLWDVDLASGAIACSPTALRILGLPHSTVALGVSGLAGVSHPDDRARLSRERRAVLRGADDRIDTEHRIVGNDGIVRWVLRRGRILRDARGRPARYGGVLLDVTERRNGEERLRESEERYRMLVDTAPDSVFVHQDGVIVLANRAALRLFGATRVDQLVGRPVFDRIAPESLELSRTRTLRLATPGARNEPVEMTVLRLDGERVAVEAASAAIVYDGRPAVQVTHRDISLRKAAEARYAAVVEQLAANEARLALALDVTGLGLWDFDPRTEALVWSEHTRRHFGFSADEAVDYRRYVDRLHPDDREQVVASYAAAIRGERGDDFGIEHRVALPSGEARWISGRGRVLRGQDGTPVRVIGTSLDITGRKESEAALQRLNSTLEREVERSTEDLERIWRLSTDLMLVARLDGCVTAVNPAWTELLGWSAEELLGRSFMGLVHPDDLERTDAEFQRMRRGLRTHRFESRLRGTDGAYRWFSWTAVPDARFIHAVGRDVTAEKQAAEALDEARSRLAQAQKLEAIGRLTGGIAHDFNNLLQVVQSGLQMMERTTDPERRAWLVDAMRQSIQRGATLTRHLLTFSRRQSLAPEPVDLVARIDTLRELLDRSLRGDIRVETTFADGLWPVEVDLAELELAILNIAVNARDAMPDGGTVAIRAENVPAEPDSLLREDFVRLSISDTGLGMAPDVIARAFEPFYSTKETHAGSGLGLAQVYGLARQSGGSARIESAPGRGTTVSLLLPRARAIDAAEQVTERATDPPRGRGTVLLVEDDDAVATLCGEMLRQLGYRLVRARAPAEAIEVMGSGTTVDVVVTDMLMPGGTSGSDLARALAEGWPGVPVVMATGASGESLRSAERTGRPVLRKPYSLEDLATVLDDVLRAERQGSAA